MGFHATITLNEHPETKVCEVAISKDQALDQLELVIHALRKLRTDEEPAC